MYYVCIEENKVTAILNYEPTVPSQIRLVEITDEEYQSIINETHYFNTTTNTVVSEDPSVLEKRDQELANGQEREFLNRTDWKVMRHIRQKALGIPTSLSEEEYLDLERQRQAAASRIL